MSLLEEMRRRGYDSEIIDDEPDEYVYFDDEEEFDLNLPQKMLKMTVSELVKKHGGVSGIKEFSIILKNILSSDQIAQNMRERRNELIEKDFAVSNLKKYIDLFMEEIFNVAESQTEQIISLVLSDVEEARKQIPKLRIDQYTKISKNTKKSLNDSIKRLGRKYDTE